MSLSISTCWSMAAMLRDVLVVVVLGRTHQRSMPLSIMTIQKECMGLDFYVYMRSCFYSYALLIIETPPQNYSYAYYISTARWYDSCTMMAKPMKTLELHYPMNGVLLNNNTE